MPGPRLAVSVALLALLAPFVGAPRVVRADGPALAGHEEALEAVRTAVRAGDWGAANETAKAWVAVPARVSGVWNQLPSLLRDADDAAETPRVARARALAAQHLELHEVALAQHELRVVRLEKAGENAANAAMDAARVAYLAAVAVLGDGDTAALEADRLERAAALFDRMAEHGITWMKEAGATKAAAVRALAAAGGGDAAQRIEFANAFWVRNVPALGRRLRPARAMVLAALERDPTDAQRLQIFQLAIPWTLELDELDAAVRLIDRLEKAAPTAVIDIDAQRFALAAARERTGDLEGAKRDLARIAKDARSAAAVAAHLRLAAIAEKAGDQAAALAHLEAAVALPEGLPQRGVNGDRQDAIVRLGRHWLAAGDADKALGYFERWKPESFCGNGVVEIQAERDYQIARCLIATGDPGRAFREHLHRWITSTDGDLLVGSDARIPELIITLHADDLEALVREIDAGGATHRTASLTRALTRIAIARRDDDVAALIAALVPNGNFVPTLRSPHDAHAVTAASKALGELGPKAWPALRKRWVDLTDGLAQDRDAWSKAQGERIWVVDAISRVRQPPEARRFLQELRHRAQKGESVGVPLDELRIALDRTKP